MTGTTTRTTPLQDRRRRGDLGNVVGAELLKLCTVRSTSWVLLVAFAVIEFLDFDQFVEIEPRMLLFESVHRIPFRFAH